MKKHLHESFNSFIPVVHVCEYCRDNSFEDSFMHLDEAKSAYNQVLCDTCYREHRRGDFLIA